MYTKERKKISEPILFDWTTPEVHLTGWDPSQSMIYSVNLISSVLQESFINTLHMRSLCSHINIPVQKCLTRHCFQTSSSNLVKKSHELAPAPGRRTPAQVINILCTKQTQLPKKKKKNHIYTQLCYTEYRGNLMIYHAKALWFHSLT